MDGFNLRHDNYNECRNLSRSYFEGDELATSVFINKYALKDFNGNIYESSPYDLHQRLTKEIARIENKYPNPLEVDEIFNLIDKFKYLVPQGGPMAGIGNDFHISSLSNCFVIGNEGDSISGLIRTEEDQLNIMKRRGVVGFDLSHIRPKGSPVLNSGLISIGLIPFIEKYSNSAQQIFQGKRNGALMLTLSINHPEVEDFIDAKLELNKISAANISVRIDDEFMKAVGDKKPYVQKFPIFSSEPKMTKTIDALDLWTKIVTNAWKSAEPGILFWDKIINESVSDCYSDLGFKTVSTNPYGEMPLNAFDSCRLLAINLYSHVKKPFTTDAEFDFELFEKHARLALRISDDIVDLELEQIDKMLEKLAKDPEEISIKQTEIDLWTKIKDKVIRGRRTGVGITAEGDMLAALNLKYGTNEAIEFSEKVHSLLAVNAYLSSVILAEERGPFPIYDTEREKNNPFILRLKEKSPKLYDRMSKSGRRNIALLTISPTGSTSIMTQTTSGLEPVFMVSYKRRKKINPNDQNSKTSFVDQNGDHWEEYNVFHHKFLTWLEANKYDVEEVVKLQDSELNKIIEKSPYYKATANDVDWLQKVRMQGKIQKWVDHSISVTVNLPNSATVDLVNKLYIEAWESGCKGMTIYRDGSRTGVLTSNDKKEEHEDTTFKINHSPKRPRKLEAEIVRFMNEKEKWIAIVGLLDNKPYEIFIGSSEDTFMIPKVLSKAWVLKVQDSDGNNRYDLQYTDKYGYKVTHEGLSRSFDREYWNYSKLISGIMRHGMPLRTVIDLINGLDVKSESINIWKQGIVRALRLFIPDGTKVEKEICVHCGEIGNLIYVEGCLLCNSCGHANCS
ncbi:MAG: adenosylcobalamin-dependent ribonucleoside-diphosphate reductase [Deltaproteobacteria bacterium]